MDNEASSYIASLAIELRKIAQQARLTTSVYLLDMLIRENNGRIAEGEERRRQEQKLG